MARTEVIGEVVFWVFFVVLGLLVFGPRSVTQSVNPSVRRPPVYPAAFRASSGSGRLGFKALRS